PRSSGRLVRGPATGAWREGAFPRRPRPRVSSSDAKLPPVLRGVDKRPHRLPDQDREPSELRPPPGRHRGLHRPAPTGDGVSSWPTSPAAGVTAARPTIFLWTSPKKMYFGPACRT